MASCFTSLVVILLAIVSPNLIQSQGIFQTDPAKDFSVLKAIKKRNGATKPVAVQYIQGTQALVFNEVPLYDCWAPRRPRVVDNPRTGNKAAVSKWATKEMITLKKGGKVKLRSHDPAKFGTATLKEYTYEGKNSKGELEFKRNRRVTQAEQDKKKTIAQFQDKVNKGEVYLKDATQNNEYVPVNDHLFGLGSKDKQADYNENVKACVVKSRKDKSHGYSLARVENDYSDGLYQYDGYDAFHDYDEYGDYDDDAEYENYGGYEGYDDFREEMFDGDWQEGYTAGYHAAIQRLYRVMSLIDAVPFIHRGHWRN